MDRNRVEKIITGIRWDHLHGVQRTAIITCIEFVRTCEVIAMNVKPMNDYNEPGYPDLKTVVKSKIAPGRRAKIALACAMTAVTAMSLSQCNGPFVAGGMIESSTHEQTSEATTDASETATAGVALLTEEHSETIEATEASLAGDIIMPESST
jgi:hypothetical protein